MNKKTKRRNKNILTERAAAEADKPLQIQGSKTK